MDTLGVDVGGVIIDQVNEHTDTSFFSENFLNSVAVPGVFDTLKCLVEEKFGTRVFIVSKCKEKTAEKTCLWFMHNRFYERTGILPEHVYFCPTRKGKDPICTELGITHFVDDKLEVLSYLTTVPHQFLLNPEAKEVARHKHHLPRVRQVHSWHAIEKELLATPHEAHVS